MKTGIKLKVTPEQSKQIQYICFENGVYWRSSVISELKHVNRSFLYIEKDIGFGTILTNFTEHEHEEVDADFFISTNGSCEITLYQDETIVNSFEKYGFEKPNFEGEILKEVNNCYVGYFIDKNKVISVRWLLSGQNIDSNCFHLKPIKKQWYELEENIGKAIYDTIDEQIVLLDWSDFKELVMRNTDPTKYHYNRFRPANEKEVLSLLIK